jgi:hypothetical protein
MAQTVPGGEITALDSGAFGPVTINKALTIDADGAVAGILAASGAGIVVNAGPSDTVTLRGLTLEGQGTAANGISILAAGAVRIDHCYIDNFSGDGRPCPCALHKIDNLLGAKIALKKQGTSLLTDRRTR